MALVSETTILTKKREGQSHRETKVRIIWDGVSEEQLRIMAQHLILYNLQAKIRHDHFDGFPDEVTVTALEVCQNRTMLPCHHWEIPDAWLSDDFRPIAKQKRKHVPTLEELLLALTPAEREALLK